MAGTTTAAQVFMCTPNEWWIGYFWMKMLAAFLVIGWLPNSIDSHNNSTRNRFAKYLGLNLPYENRTGFAMLGMVICSQVVRRYLRYMPVGQWLAVLLDKITPILDPCSETFLFSTNQLI
tara:strand:- start:32 stop:391 length:360 start_codon:yes stop_codon:yes gene_type:complete